MSSEQRMRRLQSNNRLARAARFLALALICVSLGAEAARGAEDNHFLLKLSAQVGNQLRTAQSPSTAKSQDARPVLTVKAGASLRVQWSVANSSGDDTIPQVTIHFFVDKEKTIGQQEAPKPGADVVSESALVMDFKPHAKSSGDFLLQAPETGDYLMRIETIGVRNKYGHEYSAAMDLRVQ